MRKQDLVQAAFSVFLYALGGVVVGLALYPELWLLSRLWLACETLAWESRLLVLALGLGCSYFLFGFCLLAVTAAFHRLLRLDLTPGRHAFFSAECLRWVLASGLHLVVKVMFLDFLMLSPCLVTWLRLLGGTIDPRAMINSKFLHDVSLLEIEEGAVIGGEAAISCHAAEGGHIVLKPIRIGKKALIGQRAIIMPGAVIGDGAVVAASAVVLKDQVIPPGEVWGGIPARRLGS